MQQTSPLDDIVTKQLGALQLELLKARVTIESLLQQIAEKDKRLASFDKPPLEVVKG